MYLIRFALLFFCSGVCLAPAEAQLTPPWLGRGTHSPKPAATAAQKGTVPGAAARPMQMPLIAPVQNVPAYVSLPKQMTFHVAQSVKAGCPAQCAEWIVADGQIGKATADEFKAFLDTLGNRKLPVVINSPGGDVKNAMEMGRLIRARGLDVIAARTGIPICSAKIETCGPLKDGQTSGELTSSAARCNSACPLVLAAGVRRMIMPGVSVGVHRIRTSQTLTQRHRVYNVRTWRRGLEVVSTERTLVSDYTTTKKETKDQNAASMAKMLNPYLREMGVSGRLVEFMDSSPFESLRWLWTAELRETRLLTEDVRDSGLIANPAADAMARVRLRLADEPGLDSQIRLGIHVQGAEPDLTLLAESGDAPRSLGAFFRPGRLPHRAISMPVQRAILTTGLTTAVLMAIPRRSFCSLRNMRSFTLNFGAALRGSRAVGLPYRIQSGPLFSSKGFFDGFCI